MRVPRIITALVLVSGILTSLALEGGGGIAGADAPTAISGSGQVVAVSNSDSSVTLKLSGRWTWSQSCTARYGLAWAVAWTGKDTPTTPNTLSANAEDGHGDQGTQRGDDGHSDQRDSRSKDVPTLYFGSKYNGMDLFPAQCTAASSDSHRDDHGDQGNGDQGNGDQGDQAHDGEGSDTQSTGTWSADHTYASASAVPAELCVNFYDLGGRPGVRSRTATKPPGGDAADPDSALQDGNFDWRQGGNCIPTPSIVTGIAPTSGPAKGGTGVTITGSHFLGAAGVTFGTRAAATYVVESTTPILAVTPAGSGTVPVTVASAAGTSGTGNVDFQFVAASVPTPPATPTITRGTSSVVVSWAAPATNGTPITAYAASTTTSRHYSCTANASSTTCTITGLTNGTTYTVTVAATNGIGTGAPSTAGGGTPAGRPLTPTPPTVTRGTSSAVVSWTAPATEGTPISGYTVYVFEGVTVVATTDCAPQPGSPQASSTQSCTITGLTNGTTYAFTVAATNGVGTGAPSSTASATPAGVPFAPATPTVTKGTSSIVVDWSPPGTNGTPIVTYTATTTTSQHYSCAARSPSTTCTITGLTNGTNYTVSVTATNGVGVSAPSTAGGGTPAGRPLTPTTPTVTRGTSSGVVSWTAPGTNGTPITGYTVIVSKDGAAVTTTECTPSAGAAQSCTVTGLDNGTPYTFTVAATNGVGTGTASPGTEGTPAGVPKDFAITSVTETSAGTTDTAVVTWAAPTTSGTPVVTSAVASPTGGSGCTAPGPVRTCTVTGLPTTRPARFEVVATNGVGTSLPTATAGDPYAPPAPTVRRGTGRVTVSWTAPDSNGSPIGSYTLTAFEGTAKVGTSRCDAAPASGQACTVTGLTDGVTYTFTVRATNGLGSGPPSPASAPVAPGTSPDLALSVVPDRTGVFGGDPVGYTLHVANTGTAPATTAVLADTLPPGLTWRVTPPPAAGSFTAGCTVTSGILHCGSGTLAPGAQASVHVVAETAGAGCGAAATRLTDRATLSASSFGAVLPVLTGTAAGIAGRCTATGTVDYSTTQPADGVSVGLCPTTPTAAVFPSQQCVSNTTDKTGRFSGDVPTGDYELTILALGGTSTDPAVVTAAHLTVGAFKVPNVDPVPKTVSITTPLGTTAYTTSTTTADYVPPVIPAHGTGATSTITRTACPGATVHTFKVEQVFADATSMPVVASGTLMPTATDPSRYVGTFVAPVTPSTPNKTLVGPVLISTTIQCPGATAPTSATFNAYIDPSGVVLDKAGLPVAGATVTLLEESPTGSFSPVPSGSAVLSPATRTDPQVTAIDGVFGWTVQAGTYELEATAQGCTFTTAPFTVPPDLSGATLRPTCPTNGGSGGGSGTGSGGSGTGTGGGGTGGGATSGGGGGSSSGGGGSTPPQQGPTPPKSTTPPSGPTGPAPRSHPTVPPKAAPLGYRLAAVDGGVFDFGSARFLGSLISARIVPSAPIIGISPMPTGRGYRLVGTDGGIFDFGNAPFEGSLPRSHVKPSAAIVGMATTPDGKGYWLVGSNGTIYTFGDATKDGSLAGRPVSGHVVGMATTHDGKGYWLATSTGQVYAFGDAASYGSLQRAHRTPATTIVGIAALPDSDGYWLAGSGGGVFAFGDAKFLGSLPGLRLTPVAPIVGIASTPDGQGYWLGAADGGIFAFGDAPFLGNTYAQGVDHLAGRISSVTFAP